MKNYLVITLGTREIQIPLNKIEESDFEVVEEKGEKFSKFFIQKINDSSVKIEVRQPNKEFPDFYTIIAPRTAGKVIDDNYELFRPIIDYPIVRPAIEYLKQKALNLDVIMLVYTDQEEAFKNGKVKFQNKENDSVYYSDIVCRLIKEDVFFAGTEIDQFAIIDNVTDLGYQYEDFKRINDFLLYPEEVKQVFLYPQGGIDQINQALILRLIETFEGKVKQLQKAEGDDFKELDFPSKFLGSLNKQKILKHLADYQFGLINEELAKNWLNKDQIINLSKFAYEKLNLNYTAFPKGIDGKFKEGGSISTKCKDLYISAKISFKNDDFGNYLWKLFTLLENIYRSRCELILGDTIQYYDAKFNNLNMVNERWINYLEGLLPNLKLDNQQLLDYLKVQKLPNRGALNINNPNRYLYKSIYQFFIKTSVLSDTEEYQNLLLKIDNTLSVLSNNRNKIAHNMAPVSINQLNNTVGKGKIEELNNNLDKIFNIEGFGIYDTIRKEIEALL